MNVSTAFSDDLINRQVRQILNFPSFKNSRILGRFLEFIIEETLHKRDLHIKEYSIAVHVLDRSPAFNPGVDSIVRIHAGRLRRALTDYYLTAGMYDPIIIQIPKGGYVPEFIGSGTENQLVHHAQALPQKTEKPLVAIFPLRIAPHQENIDDIPTLLEGHLSEGLLRFHDISVKAYYSKEMEAKIKENVLEAGKAAGADYIVTGSLTCMGHQIRVLIKLLVTATGEVLLCKFFDINLPSVALEEMQDGIVKNFIGFAEGCYQFIFQNKAGELDFLQK